MSHKTTYTPSKDELIEAWCRSSASVPNRIEAAKDARRGIAKIEADALQDASDLIALLIVGAAEADDEDDLATAAAQGWLAGRAARIKKEAGIDE